MLDSKALRGSVRQGPASSDDPGVSLPHAETLRRSLCHFAGYRLRDPADAEDAAQETLLRFLATRHDPLEPDQQMAYLLGIARHVILDMCDGHRQEVPVGPRRCERWPSSGDGESGNPLSRLIRRERADAVRHAIERLPNNQKDVVEACVIGDKTCAALADEQGEPASRIRKRKSRAMHRLRRDLFAAL